LAVDVAVAVVSAADVAAGSDSNVPIPKQTVKQSTVNSQQQIARTLSKKFCGPLGALIAF